MSTDIVPAENMTTLNAMDPQSREVAVTRMLTEARSWLAHAVEASEPASIATFKAQMATVAEATKQLGLSKEIQLDAHEMVRRAERGVGVAIRKGQESGTVETHTEARQRGTVIREVNQGRADVTDVISYVKPRPTDFVTTDELSSNGTGIYRLTDDVTDEQFDEAIDEAKTEGNLSRANVVRKINSQEGRLNGDERLDRIAEMASQGNTSTQIAKELGYTEKFVRQTARNNNITIQADRVMGGSRRGIDHNRIAAETVHGIEGLVLGLQLLDITQVDPAEADEWANSLTESLRVLNRFRNQIKEMAQ